jgi:hypothetical protein
MSDHTDMPVRPVSIFVVAFVVALLASFLDLGEAVPTSRWPYRRRTLRRRSCRRNWSGGRTAVARRAALKGLREDEAAKRDQLWLGGRKAGVVRLPVDRAVQLTAAQFGGK